MNTTEYKLAVDKLRAVLATRGTDSILGQIIGGREACLARFRPIFSPSQILNLTADQFKSFLLIENNRHWTGLNRKGHLACEDMPALRKALTLLLNEQKPLAERLNAVADEIPGMGKALITAILIVAFPNECGVWNNTSETSMKALKVWPAFERGSSFGQRYVQVNNVLLQLAKDLKIDLWTLDSLFWRLLPEDDPEQKSIIIQGQLATEAVAADAEQRFGLERHLHDFLRDNWDKASLGKEWALFAEQGDPEAGYEYPTDIGRIDLLAKHRRRALWCVIELKRAQSSDDTVGQTLRYMAWVRKHLAERGDDVEGLIIAHEVDDKLRYAITETPKVKLQIYEVSFTLRPDSGSNA